MPGTIASADLTSSAGNSGAASDDLAVVYAPGFSKAFDPSTVPPGGVSALTLTVDNTLNVADATGLAFTDNLPSGMTIADPATADTTCTGGVLTADPGAGVITYTGGSVAAGATCTISVDVVAAEPGEYLNDAGSLTSSLGSSPQGATVDTLLAAGLIPILSPTGTVMLCILLALSAVIVIHRHRT